MDVRHRAPAGAQATASGLTPKVSSGEVGGVTTKLGSQAGQSATSAFLHGYGIAIATCALALLLAAGGAYAGLRRRAAPVSADGISPATS